VSVYFLLAPIPISLPVPLSFLSSMQVPIVCLLLFLCPHLSISLCSPESKCLLFAYFHFPCSHFSPFSLQSVSAHYLLAFIPIFLYCSCSLGSESLLLICFYFHILTLFLFSREWAPIAYILLFFYHHLSLSFFTLQPVSAHCLLSYILNFSLTLFSLLSSL
jgi:hypothetical protein